MIGNAVLVVRIAAGGVEEFDPEEEDSRVAASYLVSNIGTPIDALNSVQLATFALRHLAG